MYVVNLNVSRIPTGLRYIDGELMVYSTRIITDKWETTRFETWKVGKIKSDGNIHWAPDRKPGRRSYGNKPRVVGRIGGIPSELAVSVAPHVIRGKVLTVGETLSFCKRMYEVDIRNKDSPLIRLLIEYAGPEILPVSVLRSDTGAIHTRTGSSRAGVHVLNSIDSYFSGKEVLTLEGSSAISYMHPSKAIYRVDSRHGVSHFARYTSVGEPLYHITFNPVLAGYCTAFAVSDCEKYVAIAMLNGGVHLYDVLEESTLRLLTSYDLAATSLVFNPDGTTLAALTHTATKHKKYRSSVNIIDL